MKRPQWIFLSASLLTAILLFAATQQQFFGNKPRANAGGTAAATAQASAISIDTILIHAKENLTPSQIMRLTELENGISRGDVAAQKQHALHQLADFWKDSARLFAPLPLYGRSRPVGKFRKIPHFCSPFVFAGFTERTKS